MATGTGKRGKPKLSEEEKALKAAERATPAGIREQLEKNRIKQNKLMADLAIKEHPELESSITTITNFIQELQKSDNAIKMGAEANVQAERDRVAKQIEFYQNKIKALQDAQSKADSSSIVDQLRTNRTTALKNLKRAMNAVSEDFKKVGVNLGDLIPTVSPYEAELATVSVDDTSAVSV
jgi:hypothetical protein